MVASRDSLIRAVADSLHLNSQEINDLRIIKRSVDARRKPVKLNLTVRVATGDDSTILPAERPVDFHPVPYDAPVVAVVGAGPAGLFAALQLIRSGIKPIVFERGKDVDSRRLDIAKINRKRKINPDSNYCFGEGGAGTFSDGKLYTRSKKRGDNEQVLQLLVQFGASPDILIDAHPHIGSDRLPNVIRNIRKAIIHYGGEVRFETKVESLLLKEGRVAGVVTDRGEQLASAVILATGHSARDTFRSLCNQAVDMQPKGIAIGVRLEHPQELIDRIQYHSQKGRGGHLPAAEYNFVTQVDGRGVYSFCMCPGGVIVPAASGPDQLVVNGMSASARSGRWANSGMVVQIQPGDFPEFDHLAPLQILALQEKLENDFYRAADNSIVAPAQRMVDFTENHESETLPATSYAPGIRSADFNRLLPPFIAERLRQGFINFGRKAHGFLTNEAVLIGLESRTSSPVRIVRDPGTLQSLSTPGLYPAGEGAGYAGGIVSAAVDGIRCAQAAANNINQPDSANLKCQPESGPNS